MVSVTMSSEAKARLDLLSERLGVHRGAFIESLIMAYPLQDKKKRGSNELQDIDKYIERVKKRLEEG